MKAERLFEEVPQPPKREQNGVRLELTMEEARIVRTVLGSVVGGGGKRDKTSSMLRELGHAIGLASWEQTGIQTEGYLRFVE